MLLYKYRPLKKLDRVLDILLHERLFCSYYSELNDPFEGQFRIMFPNAIIGSGGMTHPGAMYPPEYDTAFVDRVRVGSLSATSRDVRMWSHYADGHNGVAIEIDCSGLDVHEVRYRPGLLKVIRDMHLSEPKPELILTGKTKQWDYEEEYRFIQESEFVDVGGRIQRILLGINVSEDATSDRSRQGLYNRGQAAR